MTKIKGFEKGMGIGGWLTNYKRFNVLPKDKWLDITIGDMEHFESYITRDDIVNIKNMGLDHIRLGFDQIVLEKAPFQYRDEIIALIVNFVSWCKEEGLSVVLNLHKAIGNYCDIEEDETLFDSERLWDRFIALWLKLEDTFKNDKDIMFELLNEVRDIDPCVWNFLAERTIFAIREKNPERKIIIGPTAWNTPWKLEHLKVFDDENVIYTFHMYAPAEFTHQRGVLHWKELYYNRALSYPCDDIEKYRDYERLLYGKEKPYEKFDKMDIQFIYEYLKPAFDFVEAHPDKILWCGEFGTIRHADIKSRENYMRDVIFLLKEHNIPYCVWNYLSTPNDGNRFSLVDDDTRRILSSRMLEIINGQV